MKTWTEDMIADLLARADNRVLYKMLHSLYERQTASEQSAEQTQNLNNVGFNAYDAKFLTSVAKGGEKYNRVSDNQAPHVRKALRKYRKQLTEIANSNEFKRNYLHNQQEKMRISPEQAVVKDDFAQAAVEANDKKPWGGRFENTSYTLDKKIDEESARVTAVMEKPVAVQEQALQGNLYSKSWDEVFKTCEHDWRGIDTGRMCAKCGIKEEMR